MASFKLADPKPGSFAKRGLRVGDRVVEGCGNVTGRVWKNTCARKEGRSLWCILLGCQDFNFLPTHGFSIKPLELNF